MKKQTQSVLLAIETGLLVLILLIGGFIWWTGHKKTELVREKSPDGTYAVVIWEKGIPDALGSDHVEVSLYETGDLGRYWISFLAEVANEGAPARYQIEWLEDGVKIRLSGKEQPDAVYILPFEATE